MAKRHAKKQPPFRISIGPANISEDEAEIRLNKAFDIVFDEVLRRKGAREQRKRRRPKGS